MLQGTTKGVKAPKEEFEDNRAGNSQNMIQPAPTPDDMSLDAARYGREFCERAQCRMLSGSTPRCSNIRLLRRSLDR